MEISLELARWLPTIDKQLCDGRSEADLAGSMVTPTPLEGSYNSKRSRGPNVVVGLLPLSAQEFAHEPSDLLTAVPLE